MRADGAGTIGPWLLSPPTTPGVPDSMFGYPVVTSPQVASFGSAARIMGFGDYSSYYARDAGMRWERSVDFAFDKDLVTFRALWRLDGDFVTTEGVRTMAQVA